MNRVNCDLIRLEKLRISDPLQYNKQVCEAIKSTTEKMVLPRISNDDFENLKTNLIGYNPKPSEDMNQTFLQLRDAFLIIKENNMEEMYNDVINHITHYLQQYDYVFQQITDPKTSKRIMEQTTRILNFQINLFNIKYKKLLENNTITSLDDPITDNKKGDIA